MRGGYHWSCFNKLSVVSDLWQTSYLNILSRLVREGDMNFKKMDWVDVYKEKILETFCDPVSGKDRKSVV